ncbi:MAG: FtsX-like permease family protein [Ginsengibacter sp.]
MGIALFILTIAAVNFINLSTAQSTQRSKEVGVCKVLGSGRRNLVFQFLTESFVLTSIAIIIAVLLVNPVIYVFSSFIPQGIKFHPFNTSMLLFLCGLLLSTSLLAGFYPAKVLSSFVPVLSLKGVTITGTGGRRLRKALIVLQFTISLIFIIGTLVISHQIQFMRTKDKGFKTDAILTINNWHDQTGKMQLLADKIRRMGGVQNVIAQSLPPMGFADMGGIFTYKGKNETTLEVSIKNGNESFIPFYQMNLIAGRNIHHSDSLDELVINEAFSRKMRFTKPIEALGKILYENEKPHPIVGVVADFHQGSLHDPIKPVVIQHQPEWESSLAVSLATKGKRVNESKNIVAQIEKEWKQLYPGTGFSYSFLDESIRWLFQKDEQTAWLMNAGMIVTIFISCMGTFWAGYVHGTKTH